jgi:heparanase 1
MFRALYVLVLLTFAGRGFSQQVASIAITPARMPRVTTVDPRFVSYNIEMVEVTGGRFWKPYSQTHSGPSSASDADPKVGVSPYLYQYRPPVDLANPRLRNLAKNLGPAYIRVSGSWANSTYFQDDENPPLKQAPAGFDTVLTRAEWKGVLEFAHAVGAEVMTSFAISPGTKGADGIWTSTQAKALLDFTKASKGRIAAAEFMNEPTLAAMHGAPKDYDAAAFAADIKVFRSFLREQSPDTLLVGPGGVAEGGSTAFPVKIISTEDMLKATGAIFDVFSYHFYGATSRRCTAIGRGRGITIDRALSPDWLDRTEQTEAFYAERRDKLLPDKPIWLTETAEAACGGDDFAAEFADSFRFVNQLGLLARKGVKTVMHNTLAASDYALLDENTLEPRPNYWAAVLWNRTMGPTVLDPVASEHGAFRIYAHCLKNSRGGVAVVALNTDKEEHALGVPVAGERFTLTAPDLGSTTVLLNNSALNARADGTLPVMKGHRFRAGSVRLPANSISFMTLPSAGNPSCE